MILTRHISLEVTPELQLKLKQLGLHLELGRDSFEMDENHPQWENVKSLIQKSIIHIGVFSKFDVIDLKAADFLCLRAREYGYPMPDNKYDYLNNITYSAIIACKYCHIGYKQIAPFRILKAPVWKDQKALFQLNWVYDEYFMRPNLYERIFAPRGLGFWPVLKHRTGEVLDNVVQLRVESYVDVDCSSEEYADCPVCGQRKYLPHRLGLMPAPKKRAGEVMRSSQFFGQGWVAANQVMFSQEIYQQLEAEKIKQVRFDPCGPVESNDS